MAALLVSELVTNSLRYASGPIGVRLVRPARTAAPCWWRSPTRSRTRPASAIADPDDEGGRGLQLVARSSRRWGTRRGEAGKTVWFELAVPG